MHETTRKSKSVGGSSAASDGSPRQRPRSSGGGPTNKMLAGLGEPLAVRGQGQRPGWPTAEAGPGAAETLEYRAKDKTFETPAQRGYGARVFDRSMDVAPRCRNHRAYLWSSLPPCSRLEDPAWRGMELSETGTERPGARRRRHSEMAGRTLAPYKKTPSEPEEAWSFSMRAASCFSRLCGAPGRPEAKRLSFVSGIVVIGSPPSVPSPLLHVGRDTVSTGLSTPTTLAAGRFWASFRVCGDICPMALRSSGTEDSRIGQRGSKSGLLNAGGLSSSGCQLTPQTSIRSRQSGVTPSMGTWRTSLPTTFRTSNRPSCPPWPGQKAKNTCFRPSSEQQG
jgi:hypothetical protein